MITTDDRSTQNERRENERENMHYAKLLCKRMTADFMYACVCEQMGFHGGDDCGHSSTNGCDQGMSPSDCCIQQLVVVERGGVRGRDTTVHGHLYIFWVWSRTKGSSCGNLARG